MKLSTAMKRAILEIASPENLSGFNRYTEWGNGVRTTQALLRHGLIECRVERTFFSNYEVDYRFIGYFLTTEGYKQADQAGLLSQWGE